MTRAELVESAATLQMDFSESDHDAVEAAASAMTADVNRTVLGRADCAELVGGETNLALARDNHTSHCNYLASLMYIYEPVIFVDTLLWVLKTYRARGFRRAYWHVQLAAWKEAAQTHLPAPLASRLSQLYDWMLAHMDALIHVAETSEGPAPATAHPQTAGEHP